MTEPDLNLQGQGLGLQNFALWLSQTKIFFQNVITRCQLHLGR